MKKNHTKRKSNNLLKHTPRLLFYFSAALASLTHAGNKKLYDKLKLQDLNLKFEVFDYAMKGFKSINPDNKKYLVINDYSQHSSNKRFYLINLEDETVEINDYVAHGKHSGTNGKATRFSNRDGSKQTSLGFYLTDKSYYGSNGFSLKLKGLEKGINDNAMSRYIVMHGAPYVSDNFVDRHGRIGRSWGCPAISKGNIKGVINKIEDGVVMLSYSNHSNYLDQSSFSKLNKEVNTL